MPQPTLEERYDEKIAARMLKDGHKWGGGLPQYLGIELVRFEPGKLWCRATVGDELLTPMGNLHGGAVAAIVDHVTGVVMYPLMPSGYWAATTEIKTNYVTALTAGVLETESTVIAMTNRSAVVRGEVYSDGKLAAAAQATLTIVAPRA
jgi:1,4-dihydroxy-2-naphthoyl-CoA hydrolase